MMKKKRSIRYFYELLSWPQPHAFIVAASAGPALLGPIRDPQEDMKKSDEGRTSTNDVFSRGTTATTSLWL